MNHKWTVDVDVDVDDDNDNDDHDNNRIKLLSKDITWLLMNNVMIKNIMMMKIIMQVTQCCHDQE